jgi:hypothetical protein
MIDYIKAKLAVMRDVKYLRKDKRMQAGGSYTYIGESAIVRRLRRAMIENGIAVAPINMELVSRESFQTAKGGTSHSTILKVTWRFSHESGQSEDVTTIGEAADHGDKATNKAMTAAKKYALLLWGLIETGDDPDDTSSEQYRRAPTSTNGKIDSEALPTTPAPPLKSDQFKKFAIELDKFVGPNKRFSSRPDAWAEAVLCAGSGWNGETLKTCQDDAVFKAILEKINQPVRA